MQQQPYYGGGGYPPPPHSSQQAPPGSYPPPQPYQQYPPPHAQQSMYYPPAPAPAPAYPGHYAQPMPPYDDYRSSRRGTGGERGRGGRGRSRSPSADRPRDRRQRTDSRSASAPVEQLPSLKPGEITFALLVPAFGLSAHTAALRDIASANSCTITLQDEAQGGSATRRSLRFVGPWDRSLEAQRQVLERLNQTLRINDLGLSEETLVLIPRDRAQDLTQSLSDIQNSTNTTIEVFPARGGPDANIALVVVSSRNSSAEVSAEEKKQNEANAVARIKEVLQLKLLSSDLPDESEAHCRVFIPVAARFAGSVIGKSASIVRELESETNARINLSREGTKVETPTETFRFVTVEGNGAEVKNAYTRILQHVEEAKNRAREEAKEGNSYKVPLAVPDHLIGVIIGKGGKVLRDLQEDTGTKIHIEHSGKDDRTPASARLVEISGEPSKVENAQRIIVERLVEAMADQSFAPSTSQAPSRRRARSRSPSESRLGRTRDRGTSAGGYAPRGPIPSLTSASSSVTSSAREGEELDKMTISVPIHQVGAVIGNRGSMVRQICEESGARIHIEGRDEISPDATERGVTITGTSAQIAKAFSLVQAALAEANEQRAKEGQHMGGGRPQQHGGYQQSRPPPARDHYGGPPSSYPPQTYGAPPPQHYQPPPPGYGQAAPPHAQSSYYPPPQSAAPAPQQSSLPPPYYGGGGYAPPPPRPATSLPPLPPMSTPQHHSSAPSQHYGAPAQPQQQGGSSQFDLNILSQLAKNLAPIGSGNITQITGSPPGVQPPPGQYGYRQ